MFSDEREAMGRKGHWEEVYRSRGERQLSWSQEEPARSLELIASVANPGARVLDVGGGASALVDRLLDRGFAGLAVLDIARSALDRARARLGARAESVRWIEADLTTVEDLGTFDLWHDRAVFHFLTAPEDRRAYVALARRTVVPGGHLVLATFAPEGPPRCSGLEVCRHDGPSLARELGEAFAMVRGEAETHTTPWGSPQAFFYGVFRRNAGR